MQEDDLSLLGNVASNGFCGHIDLWLQGRAIKDFCLALYELEKNLTGGASLQSIVPGELEITVKAIDLVGHCALSGAIGYAIESENCTFQHRVEFGFEFESE
ncbi:MAG: hypothetical protein GY702_25245 [Desulfobulbaceae bacterium]|nr:hypothetical protein [Desulfobulbaceae bacterium]